jgi:hypothetical protein
MPRSKKRLCVTSTLIGACASSQTRVSYLK